MWLKNCDFWNWILWVVGFRLQFISLVMEVFHIFLVGGWGEKYVPPDPPQLIWIHDHPKKCEITLLWLSSLYEKNKAC
jgi:hypothetical protein